MKLIVCVVLAGVVMSFVPASIAASPSPTTVAIVKMKLSVKPLQTKYGMLGGYDPMILTVHLGKRVRWQNVDVTTHTATSHDFPGDGRVATGSTISSTPWSSGDVNPKQMSRIFTATHVGVFHYSCGYHVKLGQRGVIVVIP